MILHPQLEKDCFVVGKLPLCTLLLLNDANYPWFILVPQREGITEIHQLSDEDQQQLMRESSQLAAVIEKAFNADKINIAALGNMVPQLHIHHIVRYKSDPAWPAPVWGKLEAVPYLDEEVKILKSHIFQGLPQLVCES
ncbi:HIT domain-containing protein [Mariprofundus sp. KV]|uniref:HIT domain-containing protein n=1 Tax=Mariprofundus sp. KV TaxID=2608715 RepID=UPI0015A39643|nr:HIT domain-containing protein [Mariprofundus sp. KV]NWF36401.1 HIT domain-containing protein [Mariprofundus sp. KV]